MNVDPSAEEILGIVSDFLRETIIPLLDKPNDYYLLVAANSLDIVRRELMSEKIIFDLDKRLRNLLDIENGVDNAEDVLSNRILEGEISLEDPDIRSMLSEIAILKCSIDQPKYSSIKKLQEITSRQELF